MMNSANETPEDPTAWYGVRHVVEHGWNCLDRRGGSDAALIACAAHHAQHEAQSRPVAIIGDSAGADAARALGLHVSDVVPPAAKRSWLRTRIPDRHDALTRMQWHADAGPEGGHRIVLRAFDAPTPQLLRVGRQAVRVEVFTDRDRACWATKGIAARIVPLPEFAALATRCRVSPVMKSSDAALVAVVADRPGDLEARQFGFLLGLLAVAGHRVDGLMPRQAREGHLARRHIAGLDEPCRVFESRVTTLATLAGLDIALIPPSVPAGSGSELVIQRWCEALGVRFVRFTQQPAGERRQTPAMAVPVIEALEQLGANA